MRINKNYVTRYHKVCKIRSMHKSSEEKNIPVNFNLTEMKYAEANRNGMTKLRLKKVNFNIPSVLQRKMQRRTQQGCPRNLPHLNFEDKRYKHSTFAKKQSIEIRWFTTSTDKCKSNLYNFQ